MPHGSYSHMVKNKKLDCSNAILALASIRTKEWVDEHKPQCDYTMKNEAENMRMSLL